MMTKKLYTTLEVLRRVKIARNTLYKWLREGKIPEVYRDRNNFRLFTPSDIQKLLRYKNMIRRPVLSHERESNNHG
ncbi:MAG: helix-turn-helix domain-containing protein [Candidatus Omnitrophica bacterium]|nr:helix-turn-helix domain-containing protein [Candidatus Omnitrophota bacterium]